MPEFEDLFIASFAWAVNIHDHTMLRVHDLLEPNLLSGVAHRDVDAEIEARSRNQGRLHVQILRLHSGELNELSGAETNLFGGLASLVEIEKAFVPL